MLKKSDHPQVLAVSQLSGGVQVSSRYIHIIDYRPCQELIFLVRAGGNSLEYLSQIIGIVVLVGLEVSEDVAKVLPLEPHWPSVQQSGA